MRFSSISRFLFVTGLASIASMAQAPPAASPAAAQGNMPVFHVQSKLVVVDVIVTDKSGKVVEGLKPADFQVIEAGKPQKIRFFEEHVSPKERPSQPLPKLPEGQYTNFPTDPPKSTMNILLFDLLNTNPTDQQYAKGEMLKALEQLPHGQQLALFVLGSRLRMLQGPSGDTSALIKAAKEEIMATHSKDIVTAQEQVSNDDIIDSLAGQSAGQGYASPNPLNQTLRSALIRDKGAKTDDRVGFTLAALEAIARTVSGYPGRKNLIWISSGIPFQIGPNMKVDKYHRDRERRDYQPKLLEAGSLLADAQIAIYPVDLKGMAVNGVGAGVSSKTFGATGREYYGSLQDQADEAWDNRVSMDDLASQTGGQAFFGSNDIANSIKTAVVMGSRYYTIAYVPTNSTWDGRFRSIDVKTTTGGVSLKYRKGYLAVPDKQTSEKESIQELASAIQLGMPASTALLMRVQVMPPDKDHKNTRIDYAVAADEVRFVADPNRVRHATLDFLSVAWNDKGLVADNKSISMTTTIQPDASEAALRTGLPGHLELDLKPGKYLLGLGVMDRASVKIGSVWVKLVVPETAK